LPSKRIGHGDQAVRQCAHITVVLRVLMQAVQLGVTYAEIGERVPDPNHSRQMVGPVIVGAFRSRVRLIVQRVPYPPGYPYSPEFLHGETGHLHLVRS
jgi:hypothetical protein